MNTVLKILCYTLLGTACIVAASVGVVAIQKYTDDHNRQLDVESYDKNATCWLVNTISTTRDGDCVIQLFDVELMTMTSGGFIPGYSAYSNFFSDACGGVVYPQNVSGLPPNMTRLPCWYRDINETTVRLVPSAPFDAQTEYLYAGAILVVVGVVPPAMVVVGCWFRLFRCVQRRLRLRWFRQHVQTAPTRHRDGNALPHAPDAEIGEVRAEPGNNWVGRLICANEFATTAALRFQNPQQVRADECPLCFRPFEDACVWWTCGHNVCSECNPKVLRAEKQWGHSQNPRCPLCRERSDVVDIVKVVLPPSVNTSTQVVQMDAA